MWRWRPAGRAGGSGVGAAQREGGTHPGSGARRCRCWQDAAVEVGAGTGSAPASRAAPARQVSFRE